MTLLEINGKKVKEVVRNELLFRWEAICEDGSREVVITDKEAFKIQTLTKLRETDIA